MYILSKLYSISLTEQDFVKKKNNVKTFKDLVNTEHNLH